MMVKKDEIETLRLDGRRAILTLIIQARCTQTSKGSQHMETAGGCRDAAGNALPLGICV